MAVTVRSLLLGIDVSPRRLGYGLVDLLTGEPVACGCEAIDLPDHGWSRKRVAVALNNVPGGIPFAYPPAYEIQAVYIEHPISRFPGVAYDEGRAVGITQAEVERRWPHAPVEFLKPAEWRKLAGLPGNASKTDVWRHAYEVVAPALHIGVQDAADALLIAVAGQRRNGENWQRAVERGAA